MARGDKQKNAITYTLMEIKQKHNIDFVKELVFSTTTKRKFRFDWAIPSLKIAIEYEGIFSGVDPRTGKARKSRHTTVSGYVQDCIKYNLAAQEGWLVLRYTAKNMADFYRQIYSVINLKLKDGKSKSKEV